MKWQKNGLIYVANGENNWDISHAYVPTPLLLDEEKIRVFVSFLDTDHIGRIGYVDISTSNPLRILKISKKPSLDIGQPGAFDDHGVTPISVVRNGKQLFLFYTGWQLGKGVRYFLFTGLAVSDDNGETFNRLLHVPVLDRSHAECFMRTATYVIKEKDSWHMWYAASSEWVNVQNKMRPSYDIRYLNSSTATNWGGLGQICITPDCNDEFGIGRPFIIKSASGYKLFYSIRSKSLGYRLGYAESTDGQTWIRKDSQIGIDVSKQGWDNEMICFAAIQSTKYGTYMFYNGNNYGETGFGVATLMADV